MDRHINKSQQQKILHCFLLEPNIYISAVMTLKRKRDVSVEEIKEAVEKAYTKNETTMSKIVLDNNEIYFENMSETGCKVFIEQRDWVDILHENEKKTFKINEGELVRTFIIDGKDDSVCVFIMAHHIVGDGHSLVLLAQDILSCLAKETVEYKPLNNDNEEMLPSSVKCSFLVKAIINYLNRQWRKNGKIFTWEDYFKVHNKFWKNRQSHIEKTVISEELQEIKANSKRIGVTVNSYIIAKQMEKTPEYETVGIPISYRGKNRSLANKVIVIRMKYKYDKNISFEENAKKIHKIIQKILENPSKKYFISKSIKSFELGLMDGVLLAKHTGYQNKAAKKATGLMGMSEKNQTHLAVTNLGNIDLKTEYDSFRLQEFDAIAASMSTTKDVIALCTIENRMTICFSSVGKSGV